MKICVNFRLQMEERESNKSIWIMHIIDIHDLNKNGYNKHQK